MAASRRWARAYRSARFTGRLVGLSYCRFRNGDIIAVDRAGKQRLGRADLDVVGGTVTAKILRKRDGKYYLAPAVGMTPIIVNVTCLRIRAGQAPPPTCQQAHGVLAQTC